MRGAPLRAVSHGPAAGRCASRASAGVPQDETVDPPSWRCTMKSRLRAAMAALAIAACHAQGPQHNSEMLDRAPANLTLPAATVTGAGAAAVPAPMPATGMLMDSASAIGGVAERSSFAGAQLRTANEVLVFAQGAKREGDKSVSVDGIMAKRRADASGFSQSVSATETPSSLGSLRALDSSGTAIGEFPLRHTQVDAEISAYLARTVIEQRYTNPYETAIEAVYTFPLGALAAVNDFVMQIGDRKIVGVVRPRAEAERIYAEAKARGQTASLLSQRPNIFTQNVANIAPLGEVTIRLTTIERVSFERGEYEYVFPMVVGPRYNAGAQTIAQGAAVFTPVGHQGT